MLGACVLYLSFVVAAISCLAMAALLALQQRGLIRFLLALVLFIIVLAFCYLIHDFYFPVT
jgi:hypothetical protein